MYVQISSTPLNKAKIPRVLPGYIPDVGAGGTKM
jgi:hypothetical protein